MKKHTEKCAFNKKQPCGCDGTCDCDGSHTFTELYEHRYALWIALLKTKKSGVWRSRRHADGSEYKGYFILGYKYEKGEQISYHLPMRKWKKTEFARTIPNAPIWDGHTSDDVLDRLK